MGICSPKLEAASALRPEGCSGVSTWCEPSFAPTDEQRLLRSDGVEGAEEGREATQRPLKQIAQAQLDQLQRQRCGQGSPQQYNGLDGPGQYAPIIPGLSGGALEGTEHGAKSWSGMAKLRLRQVRALVVDGALTVHECRLLTMRCIQHQKAHRHRETVGGSGCCNYRSWCSIA